MLTPGTKFGAYEVRGSLGAGGMGEVYRAHDTRLGRDVALKVLHGDLANDETRRERFTREARAVAALNHPHIVTIYSTEEADGVRFFTMELLEGQSLDCLIATEGLTLARFFEFAIPIADALTGAHQKQITHRDLKPANVMVCGDGRVKVLDFGLARVGESTDDRTVDATRASLTHEGTVVGTMPYMSPEQVEGRTLDHRTDLFSLGVMFYEMLSGARPFQGESSAMLMASILRDAPPDLSERRPDLPEALIRLVSRCLEKRPDDRVQTARDVLNELRHVMRRPDSGAVGRPRSGSGPAARREGLWVMVLPFSAAARDADAGALADGLTEDITAGLAKFSYLSVVAAQTAQQVKGATGDLRQIGGKLGARYLLEGTIRRTGQTLRVAARLVDARNGAQLWSETYSREFDAAAMLTVQDDLTDRIVATVADVHGALVRAMSHELDAGAADLLETDALMLRYWIYQRLHSPAEHRILRDSFEQLVANQPQLTAGWAALAHLYWQEWGFLFNERPDAVRRAREACERALQLDALDQHAWEALALVYFFERDTEGFDHASARTIALNPRNANAMAFVGVLVGHSGDDDRGVALVERAMALNPDHPGWYHIAFTNRALARGDYADALRFAKRINMPQHLWAQVLVAIAAGELGRLAEAASAIAAVMSLAPDLAPPDTMREAVARWKWDAAAAGRQMEGYRKAVALYERSRQPTSPSGVGTSAAPVPTTADAPRSGSPISSTPGSAPVRAIGTSIGLAVLPFTGRGGDDVAALAEGLTDDITTGLSRFPYLRVVSRAAAERVKEPSAELRATGAQLGARFLLEGAVRSANAAIRVTARLIDAESGAHLWAESYDRDFTAGVFAVQDEIAGRVIATVGDAHGVLVRSMAATLNDRPYSELSATELVLRFQAYLEHFNTEEHARLRDGLDAALAREPSHADGWACLSNLFEHEHSQGFNALPDSLARAARAAERAIEANPVSQEGWRAMASAAFFARDPSGVRMAAERAIRLNPLNTGTVAVCGTFLAYAGEWDRGLEVIRQAMRPNPHYPGWLHFVPFSYHYNRREYTEALHHAKQINMPLFPRLHACLAAAAGQLGVHAEARAAFEALARVNPGGLETAHVREMFARWLWTDAERDHYMEGFLKAQALMKGANSPTPPQAPAPAGGSIAVLPFADLSPANDQGWFCDGVAEEIINTLARVPELKVIARTSAFAFKGQHVPIPQIAEALGVKTVLEGSVRRADQRIRVTAQLVQAADGAQLWSERYDRELADVFAVQDDIATSITRALRGQLAPAVHLPHAYRPRVEAYEAYLTAKHHAWNFPANWYELALEHLERATALDPDYAAPYAGMAELFHIHASSRGALARESASRIKPALEQALAREPDLAEAHAWRGVFASVYEHDWAEAARSFEKALAIRSVAPRIRHIRGYFFLRFIGKAQDAVDEHHRALAEGDPLSLITRVGLVMSLFSAGRRDEASHEAQRLHELAPDFRARYSLLAFDVVNRPPADALAFAERLHQLAPFSAGSDGLLAGLAARSGDLERAETLRRRFEPAEDYGNAVDLALYHLASGAVDRAFDAMALLREQRHPFLMMILVGGPYGEQLRASPRWRDFGRTIGLA